MAGAVSRARGARARRACGGSAVGLVVLGAGTAIYFVSRADLEHAQGLLVVAAAPRRFVRPPVVGIALLAAPDRGRRGQPGERAAAPAGPRAVRHGAGPARRGQGAAGSSWTLVQQLVPPGEPIYVAPLRSDLVSFSQPAPALPHGPAERAAPRRAAAGQAGGAAAHHRRAGSPQAEGDHPLDGPGFGAAAEPNRRGRPSGSRASTSTSTGLHAVSARSATTRCSRRAESRRRRLQERHLAVGAERLADARGRHRQRVPVLRCSAISGKFMVEMSSTRADFSAAGDPVRTVRAARERHHGALLDPAVAVRRAQRHAPASTTSSSSLPWWRWYGRDRRAGPARRRWRRARSRPPRRRPSGP